MSTSIDPDDFAQFLEDYIVEEALLWSDLEKKVAELRITATPSWASNFGEQGLWNALNEVLSLREQIVKGEFKIPFGLQKSAKITLTETLRTLAKELLAVLP